MTNPITVIYRPEREVMPRTGSRWFGDVKLNPGNNVIANPDFLTSEEVKEAIELTVIGVIEPQKPSEPEVKEDSTEKDTEPETTKRPRKPTQNK